MDSMLKLLREYISQTGFAVQALGRFKCFLKICGDICESMSTGVNHSKNKFMADDVDIGNFQ
jgi:hypothetical protein